MPSPFSQWVAWTLNSIVGGVVLPVAPPQPVAGAVPAPDAPHDDVDAAAVHGVAERKRALRRRRPVGAPPCDRSLSPYMQRADDGMYVCERPDCTYVNKTHTGVRNHYDRKHRATDHFPCRFVGCAVGFERPVDRTHHVEDTHGTVACYKNGYARVPSAPAAAAAAHVAAVSASSSSAEASSDTDDDDDDDDDDDAAAAMPIKKRRVTPPTPSANESDDDASAFVRPEFCLAVGCTFVARSAAEIDEHWYEQHFGGARIPYDCVVATCSEGFTTYTRLVEHMGERHTDVMAARQLECAHCSSRFMYMATFEMHQCPKNTSATRACPKATSCTVRMRPMALLHHVYHTHGVEVEAAYERGGNDALLRGVRALHDAEYLNYASTCADVAAT